MLSENTKFLKSFYLPSGVVNKKQILQFESYLIAMNLGKMGFGYRKVQKELKKIGKDIKGVGNWFHKKSIPIIAHWLKSYNLLGKPKNGYKWLPLKLKNNAIPSGDFILVPGDIDNYRKVKKLIHNLRPCENGVYKFAEKFNLSKDFLEKNREYLFGYFLGVLIGDADKRKDKSGSRLVDLVLSKKHKSNIRFGDFFSLTTNFLGIWMDRVKDKPTKFRWRSESSPLLSYIFDKLVGMRKNQTSTYDSVNMPWIREASRDLKLGFIQGICDSDGVKIHLPGRYIRIACYPNSELIKDIIVDLIGFERGIKTRKIPKMGKIVKIVWIRNTPKIKKIFELPIFNPYVNSYRHNLLKAFSEAKRFQKINRETKKEIREKIKKGLINQRGIQKICEEVLFKYKVRFNVDVINTIRSKL